MLAEAKREAERIVKEARDKQAPAGFAGGSRQAGRACRGGHHRGRPRPRARDPARCRGLRRRDPQHARGQPFEVHRGRPARSRTPAGQRRACRSLLAASAARSLRSSGGPSTSARDRAVAPLPARERLGSESPTARRRSASASRHAQPLHHAHRDSRRAGRLAEREEVADGAARSAIRATHGLDRGHRAVRQDRCVALRAGEGAGRQDSRAPGRADLACSRDGTAEVRPLGLRSSVKGHAPIVRAGSAYAASAGSSGATTVRGCVSSSRGVASSFVEPAPASSMRRSCGSTRASIDPTEPLYASTAEPSMRPTLANGSRNEPTRLCSSCAASAISRADSAIVSWRQP